MPEIAVDAVLELQDINPKLLRIIRQFAPFGPGNMGPVFMSENLTDTGYAKGVGQEEAHLKLAIVQNDSHKIDGIGFNLGDKLSLVTGRKPFSAVFSLDENEWQGNVSLQLKLRDIK